MADELQLTPPQRTSLRDWFVENLTNEFPDDPDKPELVRKPKTTGGTRVTFQDRDDGGRRRSINEKQIVDIYLDSKLIGNMSKSPGKNWVTIGKDQYGRPSPYLPRSNRLGKDLVKAKEKLMAAIIKQAGEEKKEQQRKEKPKVSFGRISKDVDGYQSIAIMLNGDHISTMYKDDGGEKWYTYGEDERDDGDIEAESPYLYEADLGANLRDAKQAINEIVDEKMEENAALDTISGDGPPIDKPHKGAVRRPVQRSVNRTLQRMADHFKGNLLMPGDPLYGIVKAIPGANVEAKLVLLTRPHSVFVEHTILLDKKGEKALVDHNVFLTAKWEPGNNIAHKDPSRAGSYRAVFIDGDRVLYKPRKIMTVGQFIKDSETYFAVRSIQLCLLYTSPSPRDS